MCVCLGMCACVCLDICACVYMLKPDLNLRCCSWEAIPFFFFFFFPRGGDCDNFSQESGLTNQVKEADQ